MKNRKPASARRVKRGTFDKKKVISCASISVGRSQSTDIDTAPKGDANTRLSARIPPLPYNKEAKYSKMLPVPNIPYIAAQIIPNTRYGIKYFVIVFEIYDKETRGRRIAYPMLMNSKGQAKAPRNEMKLFSGSVGVSTIFVKMDGSRVGGIRSCGTEENTDAMLYKAKAMTAIARAISSQAICAIWAVGGVLLLLFA